MLLRLSFGLHLPDLRSDLLVDELLLGSSILFLSLALNLVPSGLPPLAQARVTLLLNAAELLMAVSLNLKDAGKGPWRTC